MRRLVIILLPVVAAAMAVAASAAAPTNGYFHFGATRFQITDTVAFRGDNEGQPVTIVAMSDFPIDRQELAASIDPSEGPFWQAANAGHGNFLLVMLTAPDKCKVIATLDAGQRHIELAHTAATTRTASPDRVEGTCFTTEPGKMFDDVYDFKLSYSVAVTPVAKPTTLANGGGEPGRALVALVKAIQDNDWKVATLHLREGQFANQPKGEDAKRFFEGLALNYPKSAKVTGGLMKGDRARIEIKGLDAEGKAIEGYYTMKKAGSSWRVVDQFLHYAY